MKLIKFKDIKKGNYICCIWGGKEKDWEKTFFKVISVKKDGKITLWGKKWLDICRNGKKAICNDLEKIDEDKPTKIKQFYKLTKAEFLKETEHDFMLDELGLKNEK